MIIFLDIDGVLNQLQAWKVDEDCVKNLGLLCKKLSAKVVLTSSWRVGYCRNDRSKCTPQIKNLLGFFEKYDIEVDGRTKDLGNRGKEVLAYVESHEVKKYLTLDDDNSLFKGYDCNLYVVNHKTGITVRDVKSILKRF